MPGRGRDVAWALASLRAPPELWDTVRDARLGREERHCAGQPDPELIIMHQGGQRAQSPVKWRWSVPPRRRAPTVGQIAAVVAMLRTSVDADDVRAEVEAPCATRIRWGFLTY